MTTIIASALGLFALGFLASRSMVRDKNMAIDGFQRKLFSVLAVLFALAGAVLATGGSLIPLLLAAILALSAGQLAGIVFTAKAVDENKGR